MGDQLEAGRLLIFYLLYHHNLMTLFGFRECIALLISGSVIEIFYAGNSKGNETFRNDIVFSFFIFEHLIFIICHTEIIEGIGHFCCIHLFFIIHSYVGICSIDCTFPVSLFKCFMLFLFCYYILLYSTVVLLLSFLYKFY